MRWTKNDLESKSSTWCLSDRRESKRRDAWSELLAREMIFVLWQKYDFHTYMTDIQAPKLKIPLAGALWWKMRRCEGQRWWGSSRCPWRPCWAGEQLLPAPSVPTTRSVVSLDELAKERIEEESLTEAGKRLETAPRCPGLPLTRWRPANAQPVC